MQLLTSAGCCYLLSSVWSKSTVVAYDAFLRLVVIEYLISAALLDARYTWVLTITISWLSHYASAARESAKMEEGLGCIEKTAAKGDDGPSITGTTPEGGACRM